MTNCSVETRVKVLLKPLETKKKQKNYANHINLFLKKGHN